ncbi:MAG: HEPN domain-containing protein [Armatimonadetes bacterium]|nr:HEPN domain-containing protein [Armatimonadota bacterium]MDW8028796.1 HEPN domain-containing protein [Armatimonadota bacterium]
MREVWQVYWRKAEDNLQVARKAMEMAAFDPCVSRSYFAAFHAAIAGLLRLTDDRSKA